MATSGTTAGNKVGLYGEDKERLDRLSRDTGITRARIIGDAVKLYEPRLRSRLNMAHEAAAGKKKMRKSAA